MKAAKAFREKFEKIHLVSDPFVRSNSYRQLADMAIEHIEGVDKMLKEFAEKNNLSLDDDQ